MIKKIVLTGPESTGKSSLNKALALHFGETLWLPEWARIRTDILLRLGRAYTPADVEEMARQQLLLEDYYGAMAQRYLFCDTDLITYKIWLEFKYNYCPDWIKNSLQQRPYRLYVLCGTDTPWQYDPLRENPKEREVLYQLFLAELRHYAKPFIEVWGSLDQRVQQVSTALDKY